MIHSRHSDKHLDKIGNFLSFVKKIIAVIKVFTIGFNGENEFFSTVKTSKLRFV